MFGKLFRRQNCAQTQANLAAMQQKCAQIQADLAAVRQKYDLVSRLLAAKPSENEAFEEFKKVFNEDFMAFANKESSLADEATAVLRLQALKKRLEKLVAFPHSFAKRSIAIGGGFSSGKSAFVNSFITDSGRVLPEGITPVTAIPSYVMASTDVSIKGFAHTGATVDIDPALYEQLSHDSQSSGDSMIAFRHLMPAIAVEVPLRAGFEHICLIDTPGYASGLTGGDEAIAAESLGDKDAALIWMIRAKSGTVPDADLDFIKSLELNGRPFYVVLTNADLEPPSELKNILDKVKETLEDEGLEPVGISAYSSLGDERGREYSPDGLSLSDFFRGENQPVENLGAKLKGELESVFSMYEKEIEQDEQSAKLLEELNLDLNEKVDADVAEEFGEKIDKIKQSQGHDFAPIKQELGRVKQAMFAAVKQVLLSLVDDPKSAAELNAVWQQGRTKRPSQAANRVNRTDALSWWAAQQERAKRHSQSTHQRQPADTQSKDDRDPYAENYEKIDWARNTQSKDARDPYALHEMAKIDDYKEAAALLAAGADPNAKTKKGETPLHYAAKQDAHQTVTVRVLLAAGAFPNAKTKKGETPLHYAAKRDAHQTVRVLLAAGANPNARDKESYAPLHYAAEYDAHQTVKVLLDYRCTSSRARVNSRDKNDCTPLHYAAEQDAHQTAQVLLAKEVFPNAKDKKGRTPLHYAQKNKAQKTAQLLRSSGGRNSG